MTLTQREIDLLAERARQAGLDGRDRGAVRRLIWAETGTDAVDHEVIETIADRLIHR